MRPGIRILLLLATLTLSCRTARDPLPSFPRIVLWAWERPEHMQFIEPRAVGVAVLVRTIGWRNGVIVSRPRYQPLDIPQHTAVMAVVRLETYAGTPPDIALIVPEILAAAALPHIRALQIDFDARLSERGWYASLLNTVRPKLPTGVTLNITALASWCLGDPWIKNLPVNDAVPMLFRMGKGEPTEITDFATPVCRSSIGIATDEALLAIPRHRRVFIFSPHPWTPESYRAAMGIARRLQ